MTSAGASLVEHFADLEDPRAEHLTDHKLLDIVMIAICAVICGAESWTDVELFGNERLEWLKQFLELGNGIPSHDTFGRVFALIDAGEFEQAFVNWVQCASELTDGEIVDIQVQLK